MLNGIYTYSIDLENISTAMIPIETLQETLPKFYWPMVLWMPTPYNEWKAIWPLSMASP